MTREIYLKKFSRAVRWRLGAAEAEEAIADYRELIYQEGRDPEKLVEELGGPVQAARLLTDVKTYRRWLRVFALLAVGLFLMVKWSFAGRSQFDHILGKTSYWYPVWVMMAGLALSLCWFRRHGQQRGPLPKWLILGLVLVLAVGAIPLGWTWYVSSPQFLEGFAAELFPGPFARQAMLSHDLLRYGGCGCALAALAGLVLAKCCDRRWLALYALGLTLAALCVIVRFWSRSTSLPWHGVDELRLYYGPRMALVGAAGLLGAGAALVMGGTTPLPKEAYMKRFSRAARWRLGAAEAEEAIADYRELIYQEERDPAQLMAELGDPEQAARLLTDWKRYAGWLAVFAAAAFCMVLTTVQVCIDLPVFRILPWPDFVQERGGVFLACAAGALMVLIWSRWGRRSGPLSPKLLLALAAVVLAGAAAEVCILGIAGRTVYQYASPWEAAQVRQLVLGVMACVGVFSTLAGLAGLVLARGRDRRWAALCVLALTVLALLAAAMGQFHRMDFTYQEFAGLQAALLARSIPLTLAGLIGTGVALC